MFQINFKIMFKNLNTKSTYFIQSHLETTQWHSIKAVTNDNVYAFL